jgi:hypothetical protein
MSADKEETYSYICRCKCKCNGIIFATVIDPNRAETTARDVAEMIREGYEIERVTVKYVREFGFGCKKPNLQPELFSLDEGVKT